MLGEEEGAPVAAGLGTLCGGSHTSKKGGQAGMGITTDSFTRGADPRVRQAHSRAWG